MLRKYGDAIDDKKRFTGLIKDCFPEQTKIINTMLMAYDLGITQYAYDGGDVRKTGTFIASHNIMGVFCHKKAQCEGIAKAAKVLLNSVDVKCIFVANDARGQGGKTVAHAWNIVKIDDVPCHLDITFDIGTGGGNHISYDYFNITEARIKKDHSVKREWPKCRSMELSYFAQTGALFSAKKDFYTFVDEKIKAGDYVFYFMLDGRLKAKDLRDDFFSYIQTKLSEKGVSFSSGYHMVNESMNTCWMKFQ